MVQLTVLSCKGSTDDWWVYSRGSTRSGDGGSSASDSTIGSWGKDDILEVQPDLANATVIDSRNLEGVDAAGSRGSGQDGGVVVVGNVGAITRNGGGTVGVPERAGRVFRITNIFSPQREKGLETTSLQRRDCSVVDCEILPALAVRSYTNLS